LVPLGGGTGAGTVGTGAGGGAVGVRGAQDMATTTAQQENTLTAELFMFEIWVAGAI
jgi:hypothetical protein